MKLIDITAKTFPTPYKINNTEYAKGWNSCLNSIFQQPTIDAEPVRHGHWIKNNNRDGWNCSICHKDDCYAYLYNYDTDVEDIQDYYCPYCGAKMNEVSE